MKRAIALIRTSTVKQEVESQKQEVISLAISKGYPEDEVEVIGGSGASAIKLDDQYQENLSNVYELIEIGNIECVFAWGIDRIGRNEEVLMQFKNRLISKKIQLIIKNPSLELLNSDGSVNSGVELAFSLFATMAKQEMETKQQRFHRGKKRNAEQGKFNGGKVKFGYSVNDNGFYEVNEDEAAIIREIYKMMASGKYSLSTLTYELKERGFKKNGEVINWRSVNLILKDTLYYGSRDYYTTNRDNKEYDNFKRNAPAIISKELYDQVQTVMQNNNVKIDKGRKHFLFARGLFKCKKCGHNMSTSGTAYKCKINGTKRLREQLGMPTCDNSECISIEVLDGILWEITKNCHSDYVNTMTQEKKDNIQSEINIINQKIETINSKLTEIEVRKEKAFEDYYANESISENTYKRVINKIDSDKKGFNEKLLSYKEERERLSSLLNTDENISFSQFLASLDNSIDETNEKKMSEMVHKYIKNIEMDRIFTTDEWEGNLANKRAKELVIKDFNDNNWTLYFLYKCSFLSNKVFIKRNGEYKPFQYEKIIREKNGFVGTESMVIKKLFVSTFKSIPKDFNYIVKEILYSNNESELKNLFGKIDILDRTPILIKIAKEMNLDLKNILV